MKSLQFYRHSQWGLWIPVCAYYLLITLVSSINPSLPPGTLDDHRDKLAHFTEFFFFGALWGRAISWEMVLKKWKQWWFVWAVFFIALAAGTDEIHQFFVPSRQTDWLDWVADVAGSVVGLVFARWYYGRHLKKMSGETLV